MSIPQWIVVASTGFVLWMMINSLIKMVVSSQQSVRKIWLWNFCLNFAMLMIDVYALHVVF